MTSLRRGILGKLSPFVTCSCETTSFAAEVMLEAALTVPVTSSSARLDSAMKVSLTNFNISEVRVRTYARNYSNVSYGQWTRMLLMRARPVW